MPIRLDPSSRIEYALNLTTDVLIALLKHESAINDPAIAHRAVNIAITTVLAFEQSGILQGVENDSGERPTHARAAN